METYIRFQWDNTSVILTTSCLLPIGLNITNENRKAAVIITN